MSRSEPDARLHHPEDAALRSWVASWQARTAPQPKGASRVGGKATGLLSLPEEWTPSFVALDPESSHRPEIAREVLGELADQANGRRLLVRSDGAEEALHPGEGRTRVCPADPLDALAAIESVRNREVGRDSVVVQIAIEPSVVGLMSNERRLTADPATWTIEGEVSLRGAELRMLQVGPKPADHRGHGDALIATDADEVLKALEGVAGFLLRQGQRRRVEWLWDGYRVWIVQADVVPPKPPLAPLLPAVEQPRGELASSGRLLGDVDFPGRKLQRWRVLAELDWPRPEIAVVSGDRWHRAPEHEIVEKLSELSSGRRVVRTDVNSAVETEDLLLPTSDPSTDAETLLAFMRATATRFHLAGLRPSEWAFLVAELVPCEVSTWVYASHDSARAQVDALWGYPDGLLHLPHDSWQVAGTDDVEASVRYKPACLLPSEEGWMTRAVGEPWDWQATLQADEVVALAGLGRTLAAHVASPVQLMVLARVGGRRGADALVPFHFTRLPQPAAKRHGHAHLPGREREAIAIRTPEDLTGLDPRQRPAALRVEPAPRHLRDVDFLKAVGKWASTHRVPIVFAGSVLGHAFHLLGTEGAVVIQAGRRPEEPIEEDRVPVVIHRVHGLARVETLTQEQLRRYAARAVTQAASQALVAEAPEPASRATLTERIMMELNSPRVKRPGPGFSELTELHVIEDAAPASDVPGTVPLFMDDAPRDADHDSSAANASALGIGSTPPATGPEYLEFTTDARTPTDGGGGRIRLELAPSTRSD